MRIHVLSFVVAFSVGICCMLCLVPKPAVVFKFPRPGADENHVYRGADGSCFKVRSRRVACDAGGEVRPQPIVETQTADGAAGSGLKFRNPFTDRRAR